MYRFGLIAKDIKNSVTPLVYKAYSECKGIDSDFEIFNIPEERLEEQIELCRKELQGFNITMPYNQTYLKYRDELDDSARYCGSVNTVAVKEGRLIAYNTDGWGLILALKRKGISVTGKKVVMLGAGGVAGSIAYNLYVNDAAGVDIINIDLPMAEDLAAKYPEQYVPYYFDYETLKKCCDGAEIFINASVMGQLGYDEFKDFSFLDGLKDGAAVFDVNYSNPDSKLVPEALARGIRAYNGKAMTACQGVRAFKLWTGLDVTEDDLKAALSKMGIEDR